MNRRQLLIGALAVTTPIPALAVSAPFVTNNWFEKSFDLMQPDESLRLRRHLLGKTVKVYPERDIYDYVSHDQVQIVWRRSADQTRLDYNYILAVD